MRGSLILGSDGHLTQADLTQVHQHFEAILHILVRAGMDNSHILQFLHGLVFNWWVGGSWL